MELFEFLIDPNYKLLLVIPVAILYYALNFLFGETGKVNVFSHHKIKDMAEIIEKINSTTDPIARAALYLQFKIDLKNFLKREFSIVPPRFRDIYLLNKLTEYLSFQEIKKLNRLKAVVFDNKKDTFYITPSSKILKKVITSFITFIFLILLAFLVLIVFDKIIYLNFEIKGSIKIMRYFYETMISIFMLLMYIKTLRSISLIIFLKKDFLKIIAKLPENFN
ncbi:hypothetical protein [Francisella orientalis]|uniref:Uncharacterized protein n=1 Tax=Francisella orientalis TaxID=299583 RepID=A0AAP7C500_9GAMM|nr:hypothetical protein [Francisella orientalis]AFJ42760.1 hypothetical protein OOM_0203 [Francisella orientalis str. Toba 04]AHB97890.1 hypothetical protein M973_01435 [Francisella orientalis LADL 07-285A]AKN84994.1 hypothetical protein FNO12_0201 [Francisella orientalis FNO12]AKN86532.1 Hypothetical protein FNO24_0201 [Francisella orientalis FNO24]AKN88070.1 Hypothetical protein FNO190_0201 [Francisella orientalis]